MTEPNAQTQIIERDLNKLSVRFDRHLEIYASNGKELAALKASVDALRNAFEKQENRDKDSINNIWVQTKQNTDDIQVVNVTLGKLMVRVSLIAAVASTFASSIASIVLSNLL